MWTLPNLLSASRIAMVPVLGLLAWSGQASAFLVLLVATLASDVADGWLARRRGCASELGARLDSWGDLATYMTLPVWAWLLWPEIVREEARFLVIVVAAYALPLALGWLRWGRLTSYHTWAAKLCAWAMGSSALLLFAGGPSWPFHLATALFVIEAVEEMAITLVLPRWRSDVPSILHAVRCSGS